MIVVDASVAVMWVLAGQRNAAAEELLEEAELIAPVIILLEVAHVLLRDVRQEILSVVDYLEMLTIKLPEAIAYDEDMASLVPLAASLAARHGGAAYDACYVALARQLGVPLATADRQQANIARKADVEVKLIA